MSLSGTLAVKLDAKEADPKCCIAFLDAITPAALHSVSVELRWPRNGAAEGLFTDLCALGRLPCTETLQDITINLPAGDDVDDDGNLLLSPCLQPLLYLHALRSLRVLGRCKVVMNDATLDIMSRAWPTIRILLFEWPHRPPSSLCCPYDLLMDDEMHEPPTVDARHPHGPRPARAALEDLWVTIDMRGAVPDFDRLRRPPVFLLSIDACRLTKLRMAGSLSGVCDPAALAFCLSCMLPKLQYLDSSSLSWDWDGIEKLHAKFVALRVQESNYTGFGYGPSSRSSLWVSSSTSARAIIMGTQQKII